MKKYIYIPSFDTGCSHAAGKKNYRLKDGTPWRFWSDEFPEYYRHKAFLMTAGHSYKNFDHHKIYGFGDDVLKFGDSGGFQIASGAIKYEMQFVDKIFQWLENNSNIAINLDIPPRMKYEGKFQECLDISKINFKYFADNQTGKTDFLNVLHGGTYDSYEYWYKNVSNMPFQGWAIGGAIGKLSSLMDAIVVLAQNGELKNPNNKWLHILGASSVSDFIILAQIQKSLFEIDSNITLTTDSSSPSRSTAFGIYYTGLYRNIFDATMVQSNLLNFYLYAVLYEDNIEWSNKNTKYFGNGGRCKKLPIAVKSNVIDKFYNKYGNYFSRYNFTTHDEVCDYLKIANIL